MRVYEVILNVTADNLETVVSVTKGGADLISVKLISDEGPPERKPPRKGPRRARAQNGLTAYDLTKQAVSNGPVTLKALRELFKVNGFAKTSAVPAINRLIRRGELKKVGDGVYARQ